MVKLSEGTWFFSIITMFLGFIVFFIGTFNIPKQILLITVGGAIFFLGVLGFFGGMALDDKGR